ncbi:MAG TPA: oligosaccharide flippase family protein [Verrucomicrobiae bacterium]|nr:oligosaccharide flippase family protein [Verrucomicrobiae bacterium]
MTDTQKPGAITSEPAAARAGEMSSRRSPHGAQAVLLAGAIAQLGLALLVTIYLARVLSPASFGFFSLVSVIFVLTRKFLDLGLSNVAARDIARDPRRERPIVEGMMAYRRVAGVILALAVLAFSYTQEQRTDQWVLAGVAAVLLFTEPAALDPVFQVRQAQEGPVLINTCGGILLLAGSVLFHRLGFAGASFAWLLPVREAATLLFTKLMGERLLGYRPRPGFRARDLESFVGPALLFGLASLIYAIYFNCDVFFVYALRGRDELGAYSAAYRPINPLLLLPWLLMVPLIPVLASVVARDRDHYVNYVQRLCALALGIGACGAVAGTQLAPELVNLLYHGRYLEGALSCVDAFRWLAVAMGLAFATSVLTASLLADRNEKILLAIGVVALLVNAVLNAILLRRYNFTAAGVVTAVTELLFLVCALIAFLAMTRRSPIILPTIVYLLPAAVMALVLHITAGGAAIRVAAGIVLGGVSVAILLLAPPAQRLRAEMKAESPIVGN